MNPSEMSDEEITDELDRLLSERDIAHDRLEDALPDDQELADVLEEEIEELEHQIDCLSDEESQRSDERTADDID